MKIEMLRGWAVVLALASAASGTASAQTEETLEDPLAGYSKSTYPTELIHRPFTLPKGMVEVTVLGWLNLSKDNVGKPIFLAPAITYGVDDRVSVGVSHALGFCFGGRSNNCPHLYNDVAADGVFLLSAPKSHTQFALVGGIDFSNFNPVQAGLHYGVNGRLVLGPLAFTFSPRFYVGIIGRDTAIGVVAPLTSPANYGKERVDIPVQLQLQVFSPLALFVQSGFSAPIEKGTVGLFSGPGFFDAYVVPLAAGFLVSIANQLDVGAEGAFNNFAGKGHSTDVRVLSAWVSLRL